MNIHSTRPDRSPEAVARPLAKIWRVPQGKGPTPPSVGETDRSSAILAYRDMAKIRVYGGEALKAAWPI
jgi:hypothetical protein